MFKEKENKEKQVVKTKLNFSYLPAYANFLLQNQFEPFTKELLEISRNEEIPVLKYFQDMPEEEFLKLSAQGNRELLEYLSENKAQEYIELNIKKFIANRLPMIQSTDIVSADITSISFVRRKVFRNFLPKFTSELDSFIHIMEELDRFSCHHEEMSFDILFKAKQQKINEHLYFIEKINNTTPGIIYVFDLKDQKEIYSNDKKGVLGFSENQTPGLDGSFHDRLLNTENLLQLGEHYTNFSSAGDGEIRTIEYKVKNNKGQYIWLRSYETVFKRDAEGEALQIIGIALDISKEKEIMFQLTLREQQLQEAQEISGLGSFEWFFLEGDSVFSPQLMKIFELEERVSMKSFMENVHPSDRDKLKSAIEKSMTDNGAYECQYRYHKGEHEKLIWSRGMVTFAEGKPHKMIGFAMDVTVNHILNEQLKEREKTFHQLIHNAPDAVIVVDEACQILLWNPKSEEMFGWKADEIIGKTLADTIIPENRRETDLKGIKEFLLTGDGSMVNKTIELTALNKKKEEFFVALSIAGSSWNGKPVFISFIRNISKEKKIGMELEQKKNQLLQKNIELERMNSELTSFSYVAGHDLKEPLRKIRTYSNFILDKNSESLPVDTKEYIQRIITSASNMQKLIDDLLAFSRTTSAEKTMKQVNLNTLLNDVKNSIKDTMEEKGVTIHSDELPTLPLIHFQFQQLLENIIGNAIKYSKPGVKSQIDITAKVVSGKDYLMHGADPMKDYNEISITDNGIGFDQEYAKKIFELFQRLHGKDEFSGTGIGLAICKKIVENHDGFIIAEGKEGVGSTFRIFIPEKLTKP